MPRRTVLAITAFFLAVGCASGPVGNAAVPQPRQSVETARYLGKWFELGRYENSFERDCEGVTAEYGLLENGEVSVRNTCRQGSPTGPAKVAEGRARIVDTATNAKLKVSFFGPFYLGDYWVLEHADDYSWAIVGEPSGKFLWILARLSKPGADVQKALTEKTSRLGYDVMLIRWTKHS